MGDWLARFRQGEGRTPASGGSVARSAPLKGGAPEDEEPLQEAEARQEATHEAEQHGLLRSRLTTATGQRRKPKIADTATRTQNAQELQAMPT